MRTDEEKAASPILSIHENEVKSGNDEKLEDRFIRNTIQNEQKFDFETKIGLPEDSITDAEKGKLNLEDLRPLSHTGWFFI